MESGAHFKLELGGQYHWNLQLRASKSIIEKLQKGEISISTANNLAKNIPEKRTKANKTTEKVDAIIVASIE